MNWSKAKTILIIVFLIADIFLFYVTYTGDISGKTAEEDATKVLEYMENQGISVKVPIPVKSTTASLLYVKYIMLERAEAKTLFFDSDESVDIKETAQKLIMESEEVILELNNNGEIFYLNKRLNKNKEIVEEESALKSAVSFLKKFNIDFDDGMMVKKTKGDGYVSYRVSQSYKGQFIDNTYAEVKAVNEGIAYAKILWFESIQNGKTKNKVISPVKALMKLTELNSTGEDNVSVEEISLGYYFNNNMEKTFAVDSVVEGNAVPVWRFKTEVGNIYINAYNGTVEEN